MEANARARSTAARLGMAAAASGAAATASAASGAPPLDVAAWALLAPLGVLLLLSLLSALLPRARRSGAAHCPAPVVVLPEDRSGQPEGPDPVVQAREAAVEQARLLLVEARERGADTDALLVLAASLHEAHLDLARAILAAGGPVTQAVRDELALRDRAPSPAHRQPTTSTQG